MRLTAYLILIERVAVDAYLLDMTSRRGRWSSRREAALSFSSRTFAIDALTRWHIWERGGQNGYAASEKGQRLTLL